MRYRPANAAAPSGQERDAPGKGLLFSTFYLRFLFLP